MYILRPSLLRRRHQHGGYRLCVCEPWTLNPELDLFFSQRAHLLYVSDKSGADLSTVDTGFGMDPRTGVASAPAATAHTALQLVRPVIGFKDRVPAMNRRVERHYHGTWYRSP